MIDSIGWMILRGQEHISCLSARDFSISVPVSRNLSPKQGDFCRFFGSFCYSVRRWDQMDQNGLHKNDQWKILNKISHISWTFDRFFYYFEKSTKKNCPVWGQNQKNGEISAPDGQNLYRFFLSDSTSKNTSKKVGEKIFWYTPTQIFVIFDFWPSSGGARFFGPCKW